MQEIFPSGLQIKGYLHSTFLCISTFFVYRKRNRTRYLSKQKISGWSLVTVSFRTRRIKRGQATFKLNSGKGFITNREYDLFALFQAGQNRA